MNRPEEIKHQLEIADRWRPYLTAVGVDTTGWPPYKVYVLAGFVLHDKDVMAAAIAEADRTHNVYLNSLSAAQRLPRSTKDAIRAAVLAQPAVHF